MTATDLLSELRRRGATVVVNGDRLRIDDPRDAVTPDLVAELRAQKVDLLHLLLLDHIEATWKPGEWLAYRESEALLTAKFAGTTVGGAVNVWLADGAVRAIAAESVALDWEPSAAEVLEERLCIMLTAGVPEDVARVRAEECTREYVERLRGLQ